MPIDPIRRDLNLPDTFDYRWAFELDPYSWHDSRSAIWPLDNGELVKSEP